MDGVTGVSSPWRKTTHPWEIPSGGRKPSHRLPKTAVCSYENRCQRFEGNEKGRPAAFLPRIRGPAAATVSSETP